MGGEHKGIETTRNHELRPERGGGSKNFSDKRGEEAGASLIRNCQRKTKRGG